jgi:hypothetical protein
MLPHAGQASLAVADWPSCPHCQPQPRAWGDLPDYGQAHSPRWEGCAWELTGNRRPQPVRAIPVELEPQAITLGCSLGHYCSAAVRPCAIVPAEAGSTFPRHRASSRGIAGRDQAHGQGDSRYIGKLKLPVSADPTGWNATSNGGLPKLLIARRAAVAPVQLGQDCDWIDSCTQQGQVLVG